jgi:outer membrane protein OmpA-like peptidoglycan-associated protein
VINLGEVINTPYAEYSPFLHPDGKTLYFSSDGHPGLGGLDVFKSTRLSSDSWTEWSEPVNLGKEINTPDNDWGYQFPAAGDRAYFAVANRPGGYGGSDIYSIGLPTVAKPATVITIYGTVTDPDGNFLAADIRWNDIDAGKEVGEATSDPQTGEFVINLPGGGRYSYYAEKAGYMGESEHVDLTEDLGYREYAIDIVLYPIPQQPAAPEPVAEEPPPAVMPAEPAPVITPEPEPEPEVVAVIRMNNIFFDFDQATLRRESRLELDRWVRLLKENPALSLEVAGYADSIGTEAYNQKLSERRAQAVCDYLGQQGIDPGRLVAKGFGELQPAASNDTAEGRQRNRRVEAKILNNGKGRMN